LLFNAIVIKYSPIAWREQGTFDEMRVWSANQKQELSIEEMFLLDQDETGKYCRGPNKHFALKCSFK
jgi:phosphoribosylaminoimidazole-succinocarboxamide synthase